MHIVDQGTIYDARQAPAHARFCSFTSTCLMQDGTLLVSFRYGSSKDAADENVAVYTSRDEGRTWARVKMGFEPPVPGYPTGFRGGLINEVRPGVLLGHFQWFDRSDPTRPLADPETQGVLPSRTFIATSTDGGGTWSPYTELDMRPHRGQAATGRVEVLRDGALMLPYESWKEWGDTSRGTHTASVRLSRDGGATWAPAVTVATHPIGRLLYWDQRVAVHPDDGRLIAMFWTHDRDAEQDVDMHVNWGSPDGQEWTTPVSTGLAGQIVAPIVLPDGRVLAAYVHRHDPPSLRALLSDDFGQTWTAAPELVFYDSRSGQEAGSAGKRDFGDYWADMNVWSFGHPAPVVLPSGDVFIAYYAGDSSAMGVHWVRIAL